MKRLLPLLLCSGLAALPARAATAQAAGPSVSILSERLCTERPPALFTLRAEVAGMTPPLRFRWDLGEGERREGAEVAEQPFEFGRYNVVLAVTNAAGQVMKASLALEVEGGCGGM